MHAKCLVMSLKTGNSFTTKTQVRTLYCGKKSACVEYLLMSWDEKRIRRLLLFIDADVTLFPYQQKNRFESIVDLVLTRLSLERYVHDF